MNQSPSHLPTPPRPIALCSTVAPLMAENDATNNTYVKLGDAGTPARDAATPQFVRDTLDWVARTQPVLDQHPDVDPFLRRSMQRFIIDDLHLLGVPGSQVVDSRLIGG